MSHDVLDTLQEFTMTSGEKGSSIHCLRSKEPASAPFAPAGFDSHRAGIGVAQLRRQEDNTEHIRQLANWQPNAPRTEEIPFVVARILLQDFTGVPLLCRSGGHARRRREARQESRS